jgi:hypothetical protein
MAFRTFASPDGAVWRAWSVAPDRPETWNDRAATFLPSGMVAGWLCFESDAEKRRLTPVPAGWSDLSDAEIWALCGTAEPVVRRPAAPEPG